MKGDLGSWRGSEQTAGGGERGDPREEGVLRPAPGPRVNEGRVLACLPVGHILHKIPHLHGIPGNLHTDGSLLPSSV